MRSLLGKLDVIEQAEDVAPVESFGQHCGKASALVDRVTPWRLEKESELDKYLASRMQAMLAVDVSGYVVSTNSAARGLYSLRPSSTVKDLPLSPADASILEAQIEYLLHESDFRESDPSEDNLGGGDGGNSPNDVRRFQNQITRKPILFTLNKRRDGATGQDLTILMTNDIYWPRHLGPILQDLFNLTRAEIEIVRLMVNGDRVDEIAKKRSATHA